MRTIKFRGKRLDNSGWVYGDLLRMHGVPYIYPDPAPDGWNDYEVIPDTVGQFTGQFDDSGKEIYEGDIVKTILHDSRRQMFFKVIYSMDYCGFELQEYGRYSGGTFGISTTSTKAH